MKYAVDRIEENIAIIENLTTKEKKEVPCKELPENIHEKAILRMENDTFILDEREELSRKEALRAKLEQLKKLKH